MQGVGMRPYVFRIAKKLGLRGWVKNTTEGVIIEAEGRVKDICDLLTKLSNDELPNCVIRKIEKAELKYRGYKDFEIATSAMTPNNSTLVQPDMATCTDCTAEIFDPNNRRYLYPFTSCSVCGPRYSIIESMPYDRANTTMKNFSMCKECSIEYDDPSSRRFHTQTNCCAQCGPAVELWDSKGNPLFLKDEAIHKAILEIQNGRIVALKGLGGFHLITDAFNRDAVLKLRKRKKRKHKPFAMMFPTLGTVKLHCRVSKKEATLLTSNESPIVLLKNKSHEFPSEIAPDNPYLGIMLPYTPLHHIIMEELGTPVVATSGNISDEPICIDENEALERLGEIADLFLVHNRPIKRRVDDSVARVIMNKVTVIRSARGYSPHSVYIKNKVPDLLAVGGHLKNTFSVANGNYIHMSQHIGDLETLEAFNNFKDEIKSFEKLFDSNPKSITCDKHPGYMSTQYAETRNLPVIPVQHHYAHVLGCIAENKIEKTALGVCWDGTGYGDDKTIWGGEFLSVSDRSYNRVAHFRTFPLPGGEKAIKEPRRAAIGILYEIFGEEIFKMNDLKPTKTFSIQQLRILKSALSKKINTNTTSSAGRMFDAVSSILGLCHFNDFEGQAAMKMEFIAEAHKTEYKYNYSLNLCPDTDLSSIIIDWEQMIISIIDDLKAKTHAGIISAKFHNTLTDIIVSVANYFKLKNVVLTGGCFQNKYLLESAIIHLKKEGFRPYYNQMIPSNDGGLALGQIIGASYNMEQKE